MWTQSKKVIAIVSLTLESKMREVVEEHKVVVKNPNEDGPV